MKPLLEPNYIMREVCERLRMTPDQVIDEINAGRLKAMQRCKRGVYTFTREAIEEFEARIEVHKWEQSHEAVQRPSHTRTIRKFPQNEDANSVSIQGDCRS